MERYNIKVIEKKWQDFWLKNKSNKVSANKNKKEYIYTETPSEKN